MRSVMPPDKKMKIIFDLKPSKKDISFLERQLFDFNCSKVENYSYESLIIKVISKADSIIAGIHAEIGGGWLYIVSLWVDENYRGMGFGKKLLDLAEKTGSEKKCNGVYLYTYSFQSPQFYKKLGYSILGTLENFCGEHTKFFMKKDFA